MGGMYGACECGEKLMWGERWSWKVTPCVWSPCIRCPIGRHARTMLIFKSFGCLFKVSNWYLPLEEFPPIWHRVWEQGESSLPCPPAVGMCYATGNTLALLLWSSLQWQHQTTHTATFMVFGWGFLPSLPNCLLLKLSINKQRNAMPLFALEQQLKHFKTSFSGHQRMKYLWGEHRHLNLKICAFTGRSWKICSIPMKRSLNWITFLKSSLESSATAASPGTKRLLLPLENLLMTAPFEEMLKWSWFLWSQPFWHLKTRHEKAHRGGLATAGFHLRCYLCQHGAASEKGGSLHFVLIVATYTASISSHAQNGAWISFWSFHSSPFSCPHSCVSTKCGP